MFLRLKYSVMTGTVLMLSAAAVAAQDAGSTAMEGLFLENLQGRDSVLVADQLRYGFSIGDVEEGTAFGFPDWSENFCEGVEVISPWEIDTLDVRKGKRGRPSLMDLKVSVIITSFDEGSYALPQMAVLRRTPSGTVDTVFFGSTSLDVRTMPVDTAVFRLHRCPEYQVLELQPQTRRKLRLCTLQTSRAYR